MSPKVSAAVSFVLVFIGVFVLAGLFLMPYLPPVPTRPVSAFEMEFWTTNWIGVVLGLPIAALSARHALRGAKRG
jgi:hypothetical protein